MGHRKGRLEVVQLRFFANIHVSMCLFPYIGKCCSEVSCAVGTDGDATWLRGAYQNSYPSLYVRRRCTSVKIRLVVSDCRTINDFGR